MGILRHLQHWVMGCGPHLQTAEFVPETHPIRQWADTFPWDAMVHTVEHSLTDAFPKSALRGAVRRYRPACCWPWNCSNTSWGSPMKTCVSACAPISR